MRTPTESIVTNIFKESEAIKPNRYKNSYSHLGEKQHQQFLKKSLKNEIPSTARVQFLLEN